MNDQGVKTYARQGESLRRAFQAILRRAAGHLNEREIFIAGCRPVIDRLSPDRLARYQQEFDELTAH